MTKATLDIKRWGNSLGVRLPAAITKAANLQVDQRVHISVEGGRVVIEPAEKGRLTLAQRLAAYDFSLHGGEVMVTQPIGAERW
jgi:antitoxin MazE